ncbi:NAD(P)-dependent malic enzyme [Desulfoluna butyratoxydans]|uniref:Nad(P)-binding domain n=1 Tax=Desulfoluna butyratoxydans TaxID=231438 RepID=A0A4V6ILF7_9BACT|nr:malic enzyme-like NAD(P)-binding protein [Desulfoluna butyratoxydans]VFQ44948.1 nad(p)-binding domain [Desulfoluna butyratoxydans]
MDYNAASLALHEKSVGKIEVVSKVAVENRDDLSLAYTPGVAQPCREISGTKDEVYRYTAKGNLVAVVTDGTAVLGLGDIGPEAAMPVMEGKAILFKEFADVDAFPICLASTDVEEIVQSVKMIAPTFGGINLEDISAPRCMEIEERLKAELEIPVFHDDQHGTAIVVAAALINALKVVKKNLSEVRVVVNGAGAAGGAIIKLLLELGVTDILACDKSGILCRECGDNPPHLEALACLTNKAKCTGDLADAMAGADVFIGVSAGNVVSKEMVSSMNEGAVVFAMANPTPEIMPDDARAAGAAVVGSGRSDFPNQVNNVLAFPGIFRGALDARAREINSAMTLATAYAIAGIIGDDELTAEYVIPDALDRRVGKCVAEAVKQAAFESGAATQKS